MNSNAETLVHEPAVTQALVTATVPQGRRLQKVLPDVRIHHPAVIPPAANSICMSLSARPYLHVPICTSLSEDRWKLAELSPPVKMNYNRKLLS